MSRNTLTEVPGIGTRISYLKELGRDRDDLCARPERKEMIIRADPRVVLIAFKMIY
jgi:hypothetical protein